MTLDRLLNKVSFILLCGSLQTEVTDISYDSRKTKSGDAFICVVGTRVDGHDYMQNAYDKGARVFVLQRQADLSAFDGITAVLVEDCRLALAQMSAALFDYPASKMKMIGITGTKGKTSITYLLKSVLEEAGFHTGLIGTTGIFYKDIAISTVNTTPESYEIHSYLSDMVKASCTHVVMEVSSQGLMMHRTAGIQFDIGVFTNISPDHIGAGEHDDFDHYIRCKSLLFLQCDLGYANCDDEHWLDITKDALCPVKTFGIYHDADIKADNLSFISEGKLLGVTFDCTVKGVVHHLRSNIPGEFTVYNCLSVISAATALGIDFECIGRALLNPSIKGRMELVGDTKDYSILIDYAHNAVSLETILKTIRAYKANRIVSLFGCGGNRSKLRRYEMGEISGKYADFTIITSDNSRFEKTEDIISDILVGMNKTQGKYVTIPDRRLAIYYAIDHAQKGDIILIAGKGHEMYQEMEGVKHPFDEAQIITDYLNTKTTTGL